MDHTVAAACITVGGVTVTAIAGFVSTYLASRRAATQSADNVERTLQSEHDRWLRDEKAKLYVALLADVAHRRLTRSKILSRYVLVEADEMALTRELISFQPMSRFEFDARARMFASKTVETKLRAAADAYSDLLKAEARRQNASSAGPPDEKVRASGGFTAALEQANTADQELADAIRGEVQQFPAAPPERRTKR